MNAQLVCSVASAVAAVASAVTAIIVARRDRRMITTLREIDFNGKRRLAVTVVNDGARPVCIARAGLTPDGFNVDSDCLHDTREQDAAFPQLLDPGAMLVWLVKPEAEKHCDERKPCVALANDSLVIGKRVPGEKEERAAWERKQRNERRLFDPRKGRIVVRNLP